ncbi:DNA-directed RNA polymerase sigma-70 factor [Gemmatimonadetes bacterium T265]|nr:DNA-directed RNA polymerase sigma-70 factor [Gemmatimonadetes bacterium T265]
MTGNATSRRPAEPCPLAPGAAPAVTELLVAWNAGDVAALDALMPVIYAELRRQAARAMRREADGHTLATTGLVHEAYLRLVEHDRVQWQNRAQFFGVAAQLMRRILVDHARAHHAAKRGGAVHRVTLSHADDVAAGPSAADDAAEVLGVHTALERLAALDPEQARLVELRYFGGLTIEETAGALGVSPATVKREWAVARAWLRRELQAR